MGNFLRTGKRKAANCLVNKFKSTEGHKSLEQLRIRYEYMSYLQNIFETELYTNPANIQALSESEDYGLFILKGLKDIERTYNLDIILKEEEYFMICGAILKRITNLVNENNNSTNE